MRSIDSRPQDSRRLRRLAARTTAGALVVASTFVSLSGVAGAYPEIGF